MTNPLSAAVGNGHKCFTMDEIFDISLRISGKQFELQGKIVHASPHDSGNYLCGVELVGMDKQCAQTITDYIKQHRSSMFTQ